MALSGDEEKAREETTSREAATAHTWPGYNGNDLILNRSEPNGYGYRARAATNGEGTCMTANAHTCSAYSTMLNAENCPMEQARDQERCSDLHGVDAEQMSH